jgi:hypothetical protein
MRTHPSIFSDMLNRHLTKILSLEKLTTNESNEINTPGHEATRLNTFITASFLRSAIYLRYEFSFVTFTSDLILRIKLAYCYS